FEHAVDIATAEDRVDIRSRNPLRYLGVLAELCQEVVLPEGTQRRDCLRQELSRWTRRLDLPTASADQVLDLAHGGCPGLLVRVVVAAWGRGVLSLAQGLVQA